MRFETALAIAGFAGLSLAPATLPAKAGDDLILPPDFRASTPASDPQLQKAQLPKKEELRPKKEAQPKKDANAKATAPAPAPSETGAKVERPAAKSKDDDSLSLGMKWNAAPQVNGGPGSLSDELNKNINGATVGSGAQVGFKYKF